MFLKDYQADLFTTEFNIYAISPYKDKLWLRTNRGIFSFDPHSYEIFPATTADPSQQHLITGWIHGSVLMPNLTPRYFRMQGCFIRLIQTHLL